MTGQQLKNSILQLAVQGKLVPQDPADEPASQLLARIREEKEQLIREKKIKREKNPSQIFRGDDGHFYERIGKNEPVCIDEELPFEIPETWEWARLGTIAQKITDGTHHSPANDENGDFLYITAKNIKDTGVILNPITYVSKEIHEKIYERCNPEFGDVLLIKDGATTGVVTVNNLDQPFSLLSSVALIKLPQNILSWYLVYALRSDLFYKIIRENMKGTGITRITLKQIEPLFIPLPPLAEQHRIVAKIDELLPYVDRYDELEKQLDTLNTTFPDQLKKSILQEAIQGKLVPQDPADEPASALLERIHAEKEQLIKDGKIKREKNPSQIFRGEDGHFYERIGKNEPVCIDDQLPFEIPESWEWARLGTALINRDAERIPLSVNERQKLEKIYDYYGASGVIDKVDNFLFDKPLLLIGEDGANLLLRSKPIAFIAKGKYWVNNHAHVLDAIDNTLLEYIALYINAINLAPYVTGTAQPKMNQQKMHSILLTIPPLKEQKRIIAQYNILNQTLEKLYRKD